MDGGKEGERWNEERRGMREADGAKRGERWSE
jgi:hypothetical protein